MTAKSMGPACECQYEEFIVWTDHLGLRVETHDHAGIDAISFLKMHLEIAGGCREKGSFVFLNPEHPM